jgi:hypothetical protein
LYRWTNGEGRYTIISTFEGVRDMKHKVLLGVLTATIAVGQAHGQTAFPAPGTGANMGQGIQDVRHDGMIGRNVDPAIADETYRNALVAADCILGLGPHAANALARQDEGAAIGGDIYTRYKACARQRNAALGLVIDGAVAERLLAAEGVVAAPMRAPHVNVDDAARFHGDLSAERVSMNSVARCAAVYSPGFALEVLRTEVGSESERESLASLFAHTPECGLSSSPTAIPSAVQRGAVAAALYRWTHSRA